jgi:hypothetical protein
MDEICNTHWGDTCICGKSDGIYFWMGVNIKAKFKEI